MSLIITSAALAMLAVIRLKDQKKLDSSTDQNNAAQSVGVSRQRITQANVVLDYAPKLIDLVISDEIGLDKAYEEAQLARRIAVCSLLPKVKHDKNTPFCIW